MKTLLRLFSISAILLASFMPRLYAQSPFWQQTSSGNLLQAAYVDGIQVSPNGDLFLSSSFSTNIYYTTPMYTGIFRSTDDGMTWSKTGLTNTVNPSTGNYGGTTSIAITSNGYLFALDGAIMRSSDNGATWSTVENYNTNGPAWHEIASWKNYVYAGNSVNTVIRSSDDGITWVETDSGLSGVSNITALAVDSSGNIFLGTNQGTYRSTDSGNHWTGGGTVWVTSITIDPANGYVFAGTASNGLYRSTDHGMTWTNVGFTGTWIDALYANKDGNVFIGYPSSPGEVYRSTDNGATWKVFFVAQVRSTYVENPTAFVESPDSTLIVGVDGGVYRSTDNGATWLSPPSLTEAWVTSLLRSSGTAILAGTLGNYMFQTTNDGNSWSQQVIPGLTNGHVLSLVSTGSTSILAGTDGGGIYLSTDEGHTWQSSSNGLDTNLYVFSISVEANGTIIAGCNPSSTTSGGVFSSTNGGTQWTLLTSTAGNVYSTASLPDRHIYAGTNDGALYFSADNGLTWRDTLLSSSTIRCLTPTEPGYLLAGTDYPGGLYLSTDYGTNWSQSPINSTVSFTCGVTDSVAGTFLGTWGQGVYKSTDNGSTWTQVTDGLTDLNVLSLTFDTEGHLYAGTQSDGVFKSSLSLTAVKEILPRVPSTFLLNQNYPNPFNPSTIISYELPTNSLVVLKVFDILGRQIRTLVDERQNAGSHSVRFDGANLPSGVYFYRLEAGTYHDTKKLLLLK